MGLTFEWDKAKAESNLAKHKVSFEEGKTVFGDPTSITMEDPHHSADEHRFIDIGCSSKQRVLVVVYTERDESIRLISCRKATRSEREAYEKDRT